MFLLPHNSYTIKTSQSKGRGVFANTDIQAGTVIGDYLGKIYPDDETVEKENHEKNKGLYSLWYNDTVTVCADPKDVGIHLINHNCTPNCFMYPYKGHTLYVAVRKIFKGEELTVDYLLDPPLINEICDDRCLCESLVCRGTFHTSNERSLKWEKFVKKMQGNYFNEIPGEFGTVLSSLKEYPETVDNDIFPVFGNHNKSLYIWSEEIFPSKKAIRELIRSHGTTIFCEKMDITILGIMDTIVYLS
jgi:hypothetical protein